MDTSVTNILLLTLGGVLVAGVAVRIGVSVVAAARRAAFEHRQRQLSLDLLRQRIETVRVASAKAVPDEGGWGGLRKFVVKRRQVENELGDVCSFYLEPHDGRPIPAFKPGQYLTFHLKISGEPKPVVRCYSLSDRPRPDYYRVTVKRLSAARSGSSGSVPLASSFFHDQVKEGDILDIEAARGDFCLDTHREPPVVLLAGGIGLTPLLSMLNDIVSTGSTRETWLFYGVRHGGEHIMKEHLTRVDQENDNVHLVVCYDEPRPDDDVEGRDYHHAGQVNVDLLRKFLPSNNYDFYVSAPPPMTRALSEGFRAWDVPKEHVRFETYGPETVKEIARPEVAEPVATNIAVTFARSGKTFPWDPAMGSLLEFAEANGIALEYGCRAGKCGMCEIAMKSGEVEYVSQPGAKVSPGCCRPCVSVPKDDLVLDA